MITRDLQRIQEFLFASEKEMLEAGLTQSNRERIMRLRDTYVHWLTYPSLPDKALLSRLTTNYAVSPATALADLRIVKTLLGDMNQCTTEYYRFLFMQRLEEAFQMARDQNNASAFVSALNALGKYAKLDADEPTRADYTQIVPQTFEITADPTVAGFQRIPNIKEKTEKLLARYIKDTER